MHLELVVPALFAGASEARLPAAELLLARARRTRTEPATLERWLARAFGLAEESLPWGALTALAAGAEPGAHVWLRADPVHLRVGLDSATLVPSAGFSLDAQEARALADALERHFAGALEFVLAGPGQWALRAPEGAALRARSPLELAGCDVQANLPAGADAARWIALLNEVQMLLHEHPVNAARELPVNSLWFWGAGRLPREARGPWESVTAADPALAGLARLAGMRHRAVPEGAREWLAHAPASGRHLLVLDALSAAQALGDAQRLAAAAEALERDWFAPLLAALRAERVGMVTVHVPEAGCAFETVRGDLRRFWRRPRPLATYET
ncbi:MAG: hypothetical protein N2653_11265 [Burkholderiales bacterium]|nr:hypothetical protein [Burkholderiales bacterium]